VTINSGHYDLFSVTVTCGGTLKAQPYGQTFTSPAYPNPYPNGLECVWKIDAPKNDVITLDVCHVCFNMPLSRISS
jgi:hypothetical protein